MSNEFIASNGIELHIHPAMGSLVSNTGDFSTNETHVIALREFFQHERDKELGWWRWPENPNWIAIPSYDLNEVIVFNETRMDWEVVTIHREEEENWPAFQPAARAYFAAHPERKPWHDAKPGEVWLLTFLSGKQMIGLVEYDGECFIGEGQELTVIKSTAFTAGRRIWPEDTNV